MLLTASATVDNDDVALMPSGESTNAIVPLTVINTRGPELPKTGDNGVWRYGVFGILLMAVAAGLITILVKNKKAPDNSR